VYLCARRCVDPYLCASSGSFDCRPVCTLKAEDAPAHRKGQCPLVGRCPFLFKIENLNTAGKRYLPISRLSPTLAVAVASKNIAQKAGVDSPDNCFVGGLLHDVGKVILEQYFKDDFAKVWTRMTNEYLPFYEAEQQELTVDHAKIGAYLADRWQLPQGLTDAIRWHHNFQPDNGNAGFMINIHLANILVNSYDENPDCNLDMGAMHPEVVKFLMAQMEDSADWYANLTGEIESAHAFFLGDEF
jgi:putative nucleotidyltransferase with HDIG domain